MFVQVTRGLMVAATAVAAVVAMVWTSQQTDDGPASFGVLMESITKAETVRLEIVRDDQTELLEDFSKVVGEIELTSLVSRMSLDRHEETGELIDLAISAPCQS